MRTPTFGEVEAAADRIAGIVRPLTIAPMGRQSDDEQAAGSLRPSTETGGAEIFLGLEFLQHTGSFKARGAANLMAVLIENGTMPDAGIVSATGANADIGFAWAARVFDVPATVFLAGSTRRAKVARLRALGAEVRLSGETQDHARESAHEFMAGTGAIDAYTYDDTLTSAGAGTILLEFVDAVAGLDTIVLAVGAGGMFSGIAAVADHFGIRVVGTEPDGSRALNAALAADTVLDVDVDSIAADSLGAPRVSAAALAWAKATDVRSVVVDDEAIVRARRQLWERYRLVVEHGSATGLAALATRAYQPRDGERIGVVLCGANTDPSDLVG
ncbi:pyridoxal-phosphate dependent enzyme [Nocardia sp. NPDC050408]|uniref:pyridoxal-phosphate dependent enzyme n=1 Tax=Nocardia sp. NPDC050408 TaxID=3364319 RepID=UPI00378C7450